MTSKIKKFLWRHRGKLWPTIMISLVGIPVLIGGTFLLLAFGQSLGHYVSQEEVKVEVVDKETEDLIRRRCTVQAEEGCAVYEVITDTRYIVLTSAGTFFTKGGVYDQLEVGEEYNLVVTGWRGSVFSPRRIRGLAGEGN